MIQISQMMPFFRLICLLFINGIISTADENLSHGPTNCIKPISYDMRITAEVRNNSFIVDSHVKLNVSCVQQVIRVYFERYCKDVYEVHIIDTDLYDSYTKWFYNRFLSEKQLFIDIMNEKSSKDENRKDIQPGIYSIHARYKCILKQVTTIFSYVNIKHQTIREQYLILPRIPAKRIFPYCENSTKAKFTIQINHDHAETALSHMPGDRIFSDNDKVYTSFPTTPVMFANLLATVIIPYECAVPVFSSNTITIQSRLQVKNDISYAVFLIRNITTFIKHEIEDVIPASYVHYVALPINASYETIVTTRLVLFREADVVYDKQIDSIIRRKQVTCLVVRSVIQEIFSNWLVRFKQSDIWFIEGFSTFYGIYLVDQIYNETLLKSIVVQTRRIVFDYTEVVTKYDLSMQKNQFLQNVIFRNMWKEKAFNIFYMMNSVFSKKDVLYNFIFKEAINLYNTTSSDTYNEQSILDLWNYLMFVPSIYKNIRLTNINITRVITSWITQDGYPVIQVKRNNDTQSLEIMVQDCFVVKQNDLCEHKWWIPISYIKIEGTKSITLSHFYLQPDGKRKVITNITKDDFIIITTQNGYRVNYDYKSWENIAFFLQNPNPIIWDAYELSNVSLVHLLDDAFYFLIQNTKYNEHSATKSSIDIFFTLASNVVYLEKSYILWYSISTALQYISKIFPFPENTNIKNKVLGILNSFLEKTSHKNISENSIGNQIYHEVIKWTCILDGSKCKEHVNAILNWHLENSTKNKLLQSWQKWIYCQGLILENGTYDTSDLWQKIQKIYLTQQKVEEIFEFLPCSGYNIVESLRFIEVNLLNKRKSLNVLLDSVTKYSKNVAIMNSIISRISNGVARDNLIAVMTFIINNIYSDENLEKIIEFEVLFAQLLDHVYIKDTTIFMMNIIVKKAQSRRKFLNRMRHYNLHKLHNILDYTSMEN